MAISKEKTIEILLYVAVFLNILFWFSGRDLRPHWQAVPPVPTEFNLQSSAIGDSQLAYRMTGIMLQNFGDTGGRITPLDHFDFEDLSRWLYVATALDPRSSFVPFMAAMYYGGVQNPDKLPPLLEYLSVVGSKPGKENWRWLAHAAYLARFEMKNLDLALKYARQLAALPADMPAWARQMPGFILQAQGSKDEALAVMIDILREGLDKYHPNEINHTRAVICERILSPTDSRYEEFCGSE